MKNSYLGDVIVSPIRDNYLSHNNISYGSDAYLMEIDKELDIFSELPIELFSERITGSQISKVMLEFKKAYNQYVSAQGLRAVLPKLRYYIDEEGASVIQLASTWNGGNASMYFAFEENESESSFGMVWNDQIKRNFESRSGSISRNSIDEIIHEVIDFIFRVY